VNTVFLPVDAAYDRWSASYDGYDNPMVFMAAQALEQSLADLPRGARVFEFGCGTGRNLSWMKSRGAAAVAGCDFSEGMLAVARRRCPDARLFQHDMTKPPLPPEIGAGSFDLVLFCLTLEHVADLASPLREARRILSPEGRMAIFEIHPFLSLGGVAAHFDDAGEQVRMPTAPHEFAGFLEAFARLDLRVEQCREWRPRDIATAAAVPLKALKRGPDHPLVVEFLLRR
jgi:malonyl-CoA O-methyltransferase